MPEPVMKITEVTHPEYDARLSDWQKFRLVYEGGQAFIRKYLKKFSFREEPEDFNKRFDITYNPANAKSGVVEIKNAIFQRLVDVKRLNGPASYQEAVTGKGTGVDLQGNSMQSFMGRVILPELLSMGRVGIYVDKPPINPDAPKSQNRGARPYVYHYRTEDIRSWAYDSQSVLSALLLREWRDVYDMTTGLIVDTQEVYRYLVRTDGRVEVRFYDDDGKQLGPERFLDLDRIPFDIVNIGSSLLEDVSNHQIALLNMASSDLNYALRSNFPFYVEQFNAAMDMNYVRQATDEDDTTVQGTESQAAVAKKHEISVGSAAGRKYPKGLDRPGFIHPSPEPLLASMKKQEEMKMDIRSILMLAVTNLQPTRASAESKSMDNVSLEAGLSYIGLELEFAESNIASIWAEYENSGEAATVRYPTSYSLKSDAQRQEEAEGLTKNISQVPSSAYQKAVSKQVATILVGHKVDNETIVKIHAEIDAAPIIVTDPDTLREDTEAGLVSIKTASEARLYPKDDYLIAAQEQAERAARTLAAQMSARGVPDLDNTVGKSPSSMEKEGKKQRGEGRDLQDA